VLAEDARAFMASFPGTTAYAVKTNGERLILETLVESGVRSFDVASPGEFEAVRAVSPDAELLYMHPVKAQSDIRLALEKFGVRVMALDHEDEVAKILRIVRALDLDPADITLFVRLRRPTGCGAAPACRLRASTSAGAFPPPTGTTRAAANRRCRAWRH
jgi:ornithine decarboxylase